MPKEFKKCDLDIRNADHVTPEMLRDYMVECFLEAQQDVMERTLKKMGATPSQDRLRAQVKAMIRTAFREAGGDYDNPTAESVRAALQVLARKAKSWGTPKDIIEHHLTQFEAALRRLKE